MKLTINYDKKFPTYFTINATIGADELTKVENKILTKLANQVKVTGFRKGKAPIHLVKQNINAGLIETEVMQEALNLVYKQAISEFKLNLAAQPKADVKVFIPNQELTLTLEGDVWPDIQLPDFSKWPRISPPKTKASKDDVDAIINNIKKQFATKSEVTRSAQEGDQAWIDFEGKTEDGELVPGASGKDYPLGLGSKTFIPGFEEAVIGMSIGESKTFLTTFPEDYRMESLKGKKVNFEVKLHKVEEMILPELNDELAAKCGPYKNVAELTGEVEAGIIEQETRVWLDDQKQILAAKLGVESKVDVPKTLLEDQISTSLTNIKSDLNDKLESLDEFLKTNKVKDEDELKDRVIRPEAIKQLKVSLALRQLAADNNIDVTDDEVKKITANLMQQYQNPEAHEVINSPEEQQRIRARLMSDRTLDLLVSYVKK